MIEKEFNLSGRIINQEPEKWKTGYPLFHSAILVKDVKEFIKLLKRGVLDGDFIDEESGLFFIDKLVGDKFRGDKK